jgi:hypothetical protein
MTVRNISDLVGTWKDFPLNPQYKICNEGYILGPSGKLIGSLNSAGYKTTTIVIPGGKSLKTTVQRVILMTFKPIDNYEKYEANHIDGNPLNNHIDNLEWTLPVDNRRHFNRCKYQGKFTSHEEYSKYINSRNSDIVKIKTQFPHLSGRDIGVLFEVGKTLINNVIKESKL